MAMAHEGTFLDPHLPPDNHGLIPPWHFAGQKLDKNGRRRLVMVWPNDKQRTKLGRWRDIFTGKGPGIWIAREGSGPHRPTWSNWMDETDGFGLDNCGYRDERNELAPLRANIGYDFRTRKYKEKNMDLWSDVKWSRGPHKRAWWARDPLGFNLPLGEPPAPGMAEWNPFRYNRNTPYWDWARPSPNPFYYNEYMPGAPIPP